MSCDLFKKRKVLIHRVQIQRLFSVILITDLDRAEKLEKSQNVGGKCAYLLISWTVWNINKFRLWFVIIE